MAADGFLVRERLGPDASLSKYRPPGAPKGGECGRLSKAPSPVFAASLTRNASVAIRHRRHPSNSRSEAANSHHPSAAAATTSTPEPQRRRMAADGFLVRERLGPDASLSKYRPPGAPKGGECGRLSKAPSPVFAASLTRNASVAIRHRRHPSNSRSEAAKSHHPSAAAATTSTPEPQRRRMAADGFLGRHPSPKAPATVLTEDNQHQGHEGNQTNAVYQ